MLLKIIITIFFSRTLSALPFIGMYTYIWVLRGQSHGAVFRLECFPPRRRWRDCSRTVPAGCRGWALDSATAGADCWDCWCCRGCCCCLSYLRHCCDWLRFRCCRFRRPLRDLFGSLGLRLRPPGKLRLPRPPPPADCSPGSSCSAWTGTWRPTGVGTGRSDRGWCWAFPGRALPGRSGTAEASGGRRLRPRAGSTRPPHSGALPADRPGPGTANRPDMGVLRTTAGRQRSFRLPLAAPTRPRSVASIWFWKRERKKGKIGF